MNTPVNEGISAHPVTCALQGIRSMWRAGHGSALAIRHGIRVSELAAAFHPYLTQAEGIKLCAQGFQRDVRKLSCCSA